MPTDGQIREKSIGKTHATNIRFEFSMGFFIVFVMDRDKWHEKQLARMKSSQGKQIAK